MLGGAARALSSKPRSHARGNTHRVLIIHHNKPGVMLAINKVFTESNANICQQFLNTKGDIGYVIVDTNVEASMEVKKQLSSLDAVIKVSSLPNRRGLDSRRQAGFRTSRHAMVYSHASSWHSGGCCDEVWGSGAAVGASPAGAGAPSAA